MDDPREAAYHWLADEGNQTVLLFGLAVALGVTSLVFFFVGDGSSPSRLEFVLIVAAVAVVFYISLRSGAR